jgi:proline iminopeptidase
MRYFFIFLLVAFLAPAFAPSPGPATAQVGLFQVEKLPRGNFDLYYRVAGVGRPVVILSGGPGDDCDYLMPVAKDVARSAQAIVPELRGTGRSIPPLIDQGTISVAAYLDDLEALRVSLRIDRWTVIGHSAGGLLAMRYAAAYPRHVDKLVLLDTVPVASELLIPLNDNILDRFSAVERDRMAALLQSSSSDAQHDVALLQAAVFFFDRKLGAKIVTDIAKTYHADVGRLLGGDLIPPDGYNLRPSLKDFERPVLVLSGRQDPMDPLMAAETATAFKHSTLRFIDRAGHFSWFEQPEQFEIALNAFLGDGVLH